MTQEMPVFRAKVSARIIEGETPRIESIGESPSPSMEPGRLIQLERLIAERRARERHFNPDLFADPVWDILLDMAIQDILSRPVSVSSACVASRVPTTTALRYIHAMEVRGLLERNDDATDRRRVFLRLTPESRTALNAYLDRLARAERRSA